MRIICVVDLIFERVSHYHDGVKGFVGMSDILESVGTSAYNGAIPEFSNRVRQDFSVCWASLTVL